MKHLSIIATICLVLVSISIWYYFLIFLPWIERQKMEILKNQEWRKQETLEKVNLCINQAEKKYVTDWNGSCERHKSEIDTCDSTIESDHKACLINEDAVYERCKAFWASWYSPENDARQIKANCWKRWCIKKTCDTYKEEKGSCYLPKGIISDLDIQKLGDIARCKEQYWLPKDTDTIIKQEQTIKVIQ